MGIHPDFRELLASFNARGVEYLLVGAHALAFHGAPRLTGDLDVWVRPTPSNARRVTAALADFGFGDLGLTNEDFEVPDQVVQLGYPPVRVDLMTSLSGVSWDDAWRGRQPSVLDDVPVAFLGRTQLVANKRATGRRKDLADLEALGEE